MWKFLLKLGIFEILGLFLKWGFDKDKIPNFGEIVTLKCNKNYQVGHFQLHDSCHDIVVLSQQKGSQCRVVTAIFLTTISLYLVRVYGFLWACPEFPAHAQQF